jgi:uncharacterized membrane protein YhaH (DUF805 family)
MLIVGCASRRVRERRACAILLNTQPGMEGVMDWYLMVLRRYAEFDGRSRRSEYWMFMLFNFLVILALAVIGVVGLVISHDYGVILFVPLGIYSLATLIPGLAVGVRRFHDTGRSGWLFLVFMLAGMIPIIGFIGAIIQIVFLCQDSNVGTNQFGPSPKYPDLAGVPAGTAGFNPTGFGVQPQPFTGESNFGFCHKCGAKFKEASPFCVKCGVHV